MCCVLFQISYFALSGMAGMFYGAHCGNLLNVAVDLVGPENMTLCFGLETFMAGLGTIIGPPLAGNT